MSETLKQCPICKLENQKVPAEHDYGDKITYDCSRCGRYTISSTAEAIAKRKNKSAQLSGWLRERNLLGTEIPMLTSSFIEEVIETLPNYSPLEKQNKLLKAIELLTDYPGKEVILIPEYETSLAWAQNENEFKYYLKSLMDRGLLEIANADKRSLSDPLYPMIITAKGWEHLEKDDSNLTSKSQVFVAMSFNEDLFSVYENAIKPAIEATGYRPYRVDSAPHLDRIDAKIIAEIRNSRFVVADVTQHKSGVYYEAGFAYGLGLPVIWCVRHDDLKNVHFDTRQYNHIVWENEGELKEKLENFILATIGKKVT
jgi:nucleoside 2-deoxyribosyltransferase